VKRPGPPDSQRLSPSVLWIAEMSSQFHFYPQTFALGTSIFNQFLASVKAQLKYPQCIAISCLILAAKTSEEDEVIPSVKMLAVVILGKLHWDLYTATPMDFLHIFHATVMSNWPHLLHGLPQRNPSLHVALLTRQLQHCMACHQLLQFKGSTLALVIITLELERQTPDWLPVITDLLKKAQVNSTEFISCREHVDQELKCLQPPNTVCIVYPMSQATQGHPKARPPHHNPSGWKDSHQARMRASVNHPGLAPCTPPTAQIPDDTMGTDEHCDGFRPLHSEDVGASDGGCTWVAGASVEGWEEALRGTSGELLPWKQQLQNLSQRTEQTTQHSGSAAVSQWHVRITSLFLMSFLSSVCCLLVLTSCKFRELGEGLGHNPAPQGSSWQKAENCTRENQRNQRLFWKQL
uniref:Uncharacterized protein n=1 Tax=Melopsittacus undulatus TaxID=13146 RepID=A0A8C6IWR0_MELUD